MTRGVPGGYPPEFRALVEIAFKEERFIPTPDLNTAISMRHRLNNFRVWLRRNPEADPECLAMIEQVEFGLRPLTSDIKANEQYGTPLPPCGVVAKPRGGEFASLIAQAIDLQDQSPPALEPFATVNIEGPEVFDMSPDLATKETQDMQEALQVFLRATEEPPE